MKFSFNGEYGLIYITAKIYRRKKNGEFKDLILNLALDTGASATVISRKRLMTIGYDLERAEDEAYITTGSGLITIPKIRIEKLSALGKEKNDFLINAHDLPPTASVDGVLGLDFVRGYVLKIDFRKGEIELE
ncbi:MAG TPA: retropepsin-like aspartic protease [Pyrinomonadaceae bacterium]|nr:retropepsin-like aspartic protease [Pyrinomonadaceae bacterium]